MLVGPTATEVEHRTPEGAPITAAKQADVVRETAAMAANMINPHADKDTDVVVLCQEKVDNQTQETTNMDPLLDTMVPVSATLQIDTQ